MTEPISPTRAYGDAENLQARFGIDLIRGPMIAGIVIFGSQIEYHLERAIWKLREQPIPQRPDTDGKPVAAVLDLLAQIVPDLESEARRVMLTTWLDASRNGFIIRNNIAHGVAVTPGENPMFMRNVGWHGVERKKSFGSFTGGIGELEMVRDSMAVLLRIVNRVALGLDIENDDSAMRALREARSMLGEFADHTYNPSFEKY